MRAKREKVRKARCPRCGAELRVRAGAVMLCRCAARLPLRRAA